MGRKRLPHVEGATCPAPGCGRPVDAQGLCSRHYLAALRAGSPPCLQRAAEHERIDHRLACRLANKADWPRLPEVEEEVEYFGQQLKRRVFWLLTAREQRVLRLRFGLYGEDEHTLEAIGEQLGLTRERVRQIMEYAIRKLAEPMHQLEVQEQREAQRRAWLRRQR